MKRNVKTTLFLLLSAMLLAFSGALHPLLHRHCGKPSTDGNSQLYAASIASQHPADETFCPLCTGALSGIAASGAILPELVHPESEVCSGPAGIPLFSGYALHLSRAPPGV